MNAVDRFMRFVTPEPNTGCWLWTGGVDGRGYGCFYLDRMIRASRAAWMLLRGEDPGALEVCHKCDFPPCVNPDHLFVGTHADNMRDCFTKGRGVAIPPPVTGWRRNGATKVGEAAAIRVREAALAGESYVSIARRLGIRPSCVGEIANGKAYRDVSGPVAPPRKNPLPAEVKAAILQAVALGESVAAVSRRLGISRSKVGNFVSWGRHHPLKATP